jgi:hypothetical protein
MLRHFMLQKAPRPAAVEQPLVKQAQAGAFFEPEIDHFVITITAAEAIVRHTAPHQTA